MKTASYIRQYALQFSANYPEVSFDLLELAAKVAQEEKEQAKQQEKPAQDAKQDSEKGQQDAKQAGEMPDFIKEKIEDKKDDDKKEAGQQQDAEKDQQDAKQAFLNLKSACLKAAKDNPDPNIRKAFMPVLMTIKQLG